MIEMCIGAIDWMQVKDDCITRAVIPTCAIR